MDSKTATKVIVPIVVIAAIAIAFVAMQGSELESCAPFAGSDSCIQLYEPVCAKVIMDDGSVEWKEYPNACVACVGITEGGGVVGYKKGSCPGAGGNVGAISPSAQACQEHGGTYNITTEHSGSQSGYCVLPDDSICTDEQFYGEGCYGPGAQSASV
ncbi:MAG: hypothetical protein DRO99_01120 [Candidatus Aenigmatarchaeota archaeon]|nr:MAG: hypothetical protein DRO99_01120 [Candidatus Aenigmarchaeota archaeon]